MRCDNVGGTHAKRKAGKQCLLKCPLLKVKKISTENIATSCHFTHNSNLGSFSSKNALRLTGNLVVTVSKMKWACRTSGQCIRQQKGTCLGGGGGILQPVFD